MKLLINCDVCPDPHKYQDVEHIVFLYQKNGKLVSNAFTKGRYVLAISIKDNQFDIFNDHTFTKAELQLLSKAISHLASHYPGPDLKNLPMETK